ncbi:hypothetical protein [Arsukibacterium indicum]|uniref:Uncharacterized protein n=1 Tax=Arsukibacterium indicum TaxID=2848612 RepID=A0ABS6MH95_9GAMM|nr:hypothetical protein [Arsukibacterium indicum]MBV2127706.1 hypothetical protein [Arsukibacterium indicum]
MNSNLSSVQAAALAQLTQHPVLASTNHAQSTLVANALQQLNQHCYPSSLYYAYNQRPELIKKLQELPEKLDISQTELVRLLILKLITGFSFQRIRLNLTNAIRDNYQRSVPRIYQKWIAEQSTEIISVNDVLLKDIGLLTGALLPCAERVVEPFSAIQRALVFNNGIAQGWRFIKALAAAKGNKPVCRLHIHLSEITSLTASGWRLTCQQLAELMLVNPQLKGMVGACWFYDPAIATVSPKLAFISELLNDMQASWFYSHTEDEKSGAFSRSASRKQAFANGSYMPKNYVVFIPRKRLLAWNKRQSS